MSGRPNFLVPRVQTVGDMRDLNRRVSEFPVDHPLRAPMEAVLRRMALVTIARASSRPTYLVERVMAATVKRELTGGEEVDLKNSDPLHRDALSELEKVWSWFKASISSLDEGAMAS